MIFVYVSYRGTRIQTFGKGEIVSAVGSCQVYGGGRVRSETCPWIWTCASFPEISKGNENESLSVFERDDRSYSNVAVCLGLEWDCDFECENAQVWVPGPSVVNEIGRAHV